MTSKSELFELLKTELTQLAKPVDLEELEAQGIIAKRGAWYRLLRPNELPSNVSKRITAISQDSKGVKIKISKSSKFERLAAKVSKLT